MTILNLIYIFLLYYNYFLSKIEKPMPIAPSTWKIVEQPTQARI